MSNNMYNKLALEGLTGNDMTWNSGMTKRKLNCEYIYLYIISFVVLSPLPALPTCDSFLALVGSTSLFDIPEAIIALAANSK